MGRCLFTGPDRDVCVILTYIDLYGYFFEIIILKIWISRQILLLCTTAIQTSDSILRRFLILEK